MDTLLKRRGKLRVNQKSKGDFRKGKYIYVATLPLIDTLPIFFFRQFIKERGGKGLGGRSETRGKGKRGGMGERERRGQ